MAKAGALSTVLVRFPNLTALLSPHSQIESETGKLVYPQLPVASGLGNLTTTVCFCCHCPLYNIWSTVNNEI